MKRFLAILLGLITCFSCVMATGCNDDEASKEALVIEYYKAGYGENWILNLAKEYTDRTGQTVIPIPREGDNAVDDMKTSLTSGVSETDLYITKAPSFADIYKGTVVDGAGNTYDTWYADISDVYNATIEGENITVKDKMFDAFEAYYKMPEDGEYYDNKYYFFPWVTGMMGIVVNMDVWDKVASGKQIPRTTNEFIALCKDLKDDMATYEASLPTAERKGLAPFIYAGGNEYFTSYYQVFMNQYHGDKVMDDFYKGVGPDGERYSANMIGYDGFKYALDFFEKLIKPSNGYVYSKSVSMGFQQMQGAFMNGAALFSINGDWLEAEMETKYKDAKMQMIKTPVLSAVANKLSAGNQTEEKLIELIDYVDGKTATKPSWATEDDVKIVKEAREVEYVTGNELVSYVSAYSNQIPAAKEFLKFMASDEGMRIFRNATKGCELPFTYTKKVAAENVTSFRQSINDILDVSEARFVNKKDRIYSLGGINVLLYNTNVRFATAFAEGTKNAEVYYNDEVALVDSMLSDAKKQARV